jgi:hypothetical protein
MHNITPLSFISNKALFNPHLICCCHQFLETTLQSWIRIMELRQICTKIADNLWIPNKLSEKYNPNSLQKHFAQESALKFLSLF